MKKSVFFLLFVSSLSVAQTVPKYAELEERIKAVESFTATVPEIKNQFIQASKLVTDFKDAKLVANDEKEKAAFLEKLTKIKTDLEIAENTLSVGGVKISMAELDKIIKEKEIYTTAKKTLQTMEKDSHSSTKLKKYYSLTKTRKYTQAKVIFFLLTPEEKSKANEYEQQHSYVLREAGRQEYIEAEIKRLKDKIVKALAYPENSVAKIKQASEDSRTLMVQFNIFKVNIEESLQFDYLIPNAWGIGLFSCEANKKPKYYHLKNYPNLLVLDNEGNYNAIIKLAEEDPKKLEIAYRCQNMGSFGVCLENKEKKLCKLDEECNEDLKRLEKAFDSQLFYSKFQNTFPADLLRVKKAEMLDPQKFNLISELEKMGRLGFYQSSKELYNLFEPMVEKSKTLQAKNWEDFYKKMKIELANFEKEEKIRLQKIPGFTPSSTKGTYTLQALSYMIATIDTEVARVKEIDLQQKYSYQTCQDSFDQVEFCQSYKAFKSKIKRFDSVEEVTSIVPEECPRVVFRFPSL